MRIRGRKPSADCSVSSSSSTSSTSSSSITAANSSSSSQDSSNTCSVSLLSTASHRCHGLDLLVKAIHQVTAGSVVGVPYIQRRVTIRRRRRSHGLDFAAFLFDELSQRRGEKISKKVNKNGSKIKVVKKKKQQMKKGKNVVELPTTIQDSILHPWGRRSEIQTPPFPSATTPPRWIRAGSPPSSAVVANLILPALSLSIAFPFAQHSSVSRSTRYMGEPQMNYGGKVPLSPCLSSSPSLSDENEELQRLEHAPPFWRNNSARRLSKQLSMCEPPRDMAWERRRRQFLRQERRKNGINHEADKLTDDDLHELKGCIELGFGFNEENGLRLCTTIPALDLYLAVNRQFYTSPMSSPASSTSASSVSALGGRSSSFGCDSESWKICNPGDDPQHVKTKLRHWALAVACVLRQSS